MCACWCVHGVGVVCAGVREPLRKGYGSLVEELTLDGTFSPHHLCILLGATDTFRFLAVPCLNTMKRPEYSAAPASPLLELTSTCPALSHGLYSTVLFTAIT